MALSLGVPCAVKELLKYLDKEVTSALRDELELARKVTDGRSSYSSEELYVDALAPAKGEAWVRTDRVKL